jgi:intergrase/recombinase
MRTFRVLVLAALAAGSLTVLAPAASASAPAVSKTCKSLDTLNKALDDVDVGSGKNIDLSQLDDVADAFHKAARTAPKKLKAALNTIGDVYGDMADSDNIGAAVQEFSKNAQKYSKAFRTFATYLTTNCISAS